MKFNALVGFLVMAVWAGTLQADDYRWVEGTFVWKGNGTVMTQVLPLFGETFRVNYASPQKGALRITVVDANTRKPLPSKELVKTKQVLQPGSRSGDGFRQARLLIEGDGRPWEVRLDQCLTSVQEWRLKSMQEEQKAKAAEALGVWTGTGAEEIVYDAKAPWKLKISQYGEGEVAVTVTSENATVYYKARLRGIGQTGEGYIPVAGKATISVTTIGGSDWTIEALGN